MDTFVISTKPQGKGELEKNCSVLILVKKSVPQSIWIRECSTSVIDLYILINKINFSKFFKAQKIKNLT